MKRSGALAATVIALVGTACTNFPDIPSGVCGNAVVEAGEDCDSFDLESGPVCRPKGSVGECHFDCAPQDDGDPGLCPEGWGCDANAICRQPSGTFKEQAKAVDVGAWTLSAGDFDGDGRGDVLSMEPIDAIGATRIRLFYFDQQGELAETRQFPKTLLSPQVKDVSGDGLSDVAFTNGQIGVLLGRSDRSLVPETFSSYTLPGTGVRVVIVSERTIQTAIPMVSIFTPPSATGPNPGFDLLTTDATGKQLVSRAHLTGTIADLVGDPVAGDLFQDAKGSPCLEPVLAKRGAASFTVVNTCETGGGDVLWREHFELTEIALQPPAAIDTAPQVVDLDGDGHLDVLLGAGGRAYVAYGDGAQLAPAIPYRLTVSSNDDVSPDIPMPLAVGDLTDDGRPDFVFPTGLVVSTGVPEDSLLPHYYTGLRNRRGVTWTAAKIGDFNGNGKLDVVAGSNSSLNLAFFNFTASGGATATEISTSAPIQFLQAGDFDGDGTTDFGFIEAARAGESKSALKISFGNPFALPADPAVVAEVTAPQALSVYAGSGVSNLIISSNEMVDGEARAGLTFLNGASDRVPLAPFVLTEFELNGSVEEADAVSLAAGNFVDPRGKGDLVAIAFHPPELPEDIAEPPEPWLLRSVVDLGASPLRLATSLDAPLNPVQFSPRNLDFSSDIASTSADLDRDGLDEAVFVMPAGAAQEQCAIVVFRLSLVSPKARAQLLPYTPVLLDTPCLDPQVLAIDASAKRPLDLAVLTGHGSAADRHLYVLRNDGPGGFSSTSAQLVSGEDTPLAFTVLPETPAAALGLAYVTEGALRVASRSADGAFEPPVTWVDSLNGATGIVASDVNGDRVADLVFSETGRLRVLKAQLKP